MSDNVVARSVEVGPPEPAGDALYIVGIGASAGGLSALQTLLESMPPNPGFAVVVVMHLSPEHESHLPEILQQSTQMPVLQVTSTVALQRDRVYVIPPNANLETIDTHLRLAELEEKRAERAPIDHFLRTLAAVHDGTSIGIILTGGGSDGSLGLRHIKECGGLTIAQDPEEAAFDSMPRNAIATGRADLILPLRSMYEEIQRYRATKPPSISRDGADRLDAGERAYLERILGELRKYGQPDFGLYERAAVLRRLRRRMQLLHVTTLEAYLEILKRHSHESESLIDDLLLLPTEFFMDTEAFRELETQVIPAIFDRKTHQIERIRAWSIGCSTGEEAYSLAILMAEERTKRDRSVQLQIFATELSEKVLGRARAGIYPREIAATVSPERFKRFFAPHAGFFRVNREIRDIVLFASHNLFRDPPFARLDLIVCRNLLPELQPETRRGVFNLFHYVLQPDGVLVIGPDDAAEVPGFAALSVGAVRVYRKVGASSRSPDLPLGIRPYGRGGVRVLANTQAPAARTGGEITNLFRAAIEPYTLPSVLVDAGNNVLHFSTNAASYLQIPGGELTHELLHMVGDPIRAALLLALPTVRKTLRRWSSDPLYVSTGHGVCCITLRLEPITEDGLVLVVFDDRASQASRSFTAASGADPVDRMSEAVMDSPEIAATPLARQPWQDATNESESVLSDLAASREELQTVNEELIALDDENRRRVRELTQISTDLQHLLTSTGIATLFLDRSLQVVRFTPLLGKLFGLRFSDIGRPLADMARLAQFEHFEADAQRVLERLEPVDREVMTADSHWYLSRTLPYRVEGGRVEGVVLTLIDITERKQAEQALAAASRNKDEFLAILAHELRNPLAPISAGIEVLTAAPGDRNLVERMAGTMRRQTKQLVRLVDDLLEVSRISGGKLRLRVSTFDLRDAVQDAIMSVTSSSESAGHALQIDMPQEPVLVAGDPERLTQVFSNILNNAVRYTPRPGLISVTARGDGDCAVVSIKDTGLGMSTEVLARVFEMFYQGRDARPASAAGLGIGLTLAKTLVDMHGGTLTPASAGENQGSEFNITLPLAR